MNNCSWQDILNTLFYFLYFLNFINLSYLSGIFSAGVGAFFTYLLTIKYEQKKETKLRSLEAFKLSSELLIEINIFLKSQKYFCYNYEELQKEIYYSQGRLEPLQNPDNIINLENKNFSDFFDYKWRNIFYQFASLIEITQPTLTDDINALKKIVEDIYIEREISEVNDTYDDFYEYITNVKNKLAELHDKLKNQLT